MFSKYLPINSTELEAYKSESPFSLVGEEFEAGDYIVKEPDGSVVGARASEFEAKYKKVEKKTWSRKKKADVPTDGSVVEANDAVVATA
jgi:hypothetical protein